jgi:hypothetical protein
VFGVADGKIWCKYDAVARTKYFRAEVKREGEWWSIRIPELSNLTTQARRLLDAEESARGEIAARLGIGHDAFAVEMEEVRRSLTGHEKDAESHPSGSEWGLGRLVRPPT